MAALLQSSMKPSIRWAVDSLKWLQKLCRDPELTKDATALLRVMNRILGLISRECLRHPYDMYQFRYRKCPWSIFHDCMYGLTQPERKCKMCKYPKSNDVLRCPVCRVYFSTRCFFRVKKAKYITRRLLRNLLVTGEYKDLPPVKREEGKYA